MKRVLPFLIFASMAFAHASSEGFSCSGTQLSRRLDAETVEILRNCGAGVWTRFVRRTVPKNKLVFEISEHRPDGRRFDRQLVFEKDKEEK